MRPSLRWTSFYKPARKLFSSSITRSSSNLANQRGIATKMAERSYDDAIDLLNTLQTPYAVLEQRRQAGIRIDEQANQQIRQCLSRIGYTQGNLDKLNIVHVAGTKGKGSTCAFVDSILSQYRKSHDFPKNVGLFISPHLIAVRERIRINSVPITRELFAKYFFEVWDALENGAGESIAPMEKPVYFRYLTLMSYHIFLREGVDAAVYEVGVGGEYDATNVIERPAVTGISTLGIDHVFTLGSTIDKIAWHKAGIMKNDSPALTVPQVPEAMDVLKQRAEERNVQSLQVVKEDKRLQGIKIRPDAAFQKGNASLAISLAETVITKVDPTFKLSPDALPKEFVDGLEQVVWRGRCETKVEGNIRWYIDGAHTTDSIKVAERWFGGESSARSAKGPRVLIFNQQGEHEPMQLLKDLYDAITSQGLVKFTHVIFCTNFGAIAKKDHVNLTHNSKAIANLTTQKAFAESWTALDPSATVKVMTSIEEAFDYVRTLDTNGIESSDGKEEEVHTLITGSLHLVGRALGVLEGPDAL
ncbi:Folylpolyglutamate synthase 2 [Phlyctema vagabunda]|uniref:Folylpolyglutamate synthase n=1 Tax=Phlyctema vagabunda TaxID=108571 RepID=A0ABR4PW24_9HELO